MTCGGVVPGLLALGLLGAVYVALTPDPPRRRP